MKKMYLIATIVSVFVLGLYVPRLSAYAQERAEQRQINKQILDLELEISDISSQRSVFDMQIAEKKLKIETLSGEIADIKKEQDKLHNSADDLRKQIDYLKGDYNLNDEVINCYQYESTEYNECLDSVIKTGLIKSRKAQ